MSDQAVATNQPSTTSMPEGVPGVGQPIVIEVKVRLQALAIPEA